MGRGSWKDDAFDLTSRHTGDGSRGPALAQRRADDPLLAQLLQKLAEARQLKVAAEDEPHTLGFLLVDDELLVAALVSERDHAADP